MWRRCLWNSGEYVSTTYYFSGPGGSDVKVVFTDYVG